MAEQLPAYVRDLGFTHIEFLPVNEHPFDGSCGYQPTGLFAPTSRFGSPADFAALVDTVDRPGLTTNVFLERAFGLFTHAQLVADRFGLEHDLVIGNGEADCEDVIAWAIAGG